MGFGVFGITGFIMCGFLDKNYC